MAPKKISTSAAPAMTQAVIRKLVADSVATTLEAQAANMANADTKPREAHMARKCSYKEFMSCQPFNFKGTEGAIGLICWCKRTDSVLSRRNCTEDCKVKFATSTLTEEALSWWNSFTQPIGIEEAYKITCIKGSVTASKSQPLEEAITITQRLMDQKYIWGEDQESAFQLLKWKLCEASILALPEGNEDFVVYCDASLQGLGAVLMQREKVIAYASRQLKPHK
nr:putative reverse transcriptase domain-containing protein [Tanacetum cinerariifolium]